MTLYILSTGCSLFISFLKFIEAQSKLLLVWCATGTHIGPSSIPYPHYINDNFFIHDLSIYLYADDTLTDIIIVHRIK